MLRREPRVVLLISKAVGLECLRAAHDALAEPIAGVVALDDRSDERSALSEIEELCSSTSTPVVVVRTPEESEDALKRMDPTLILVVGWYWRIPAAVLAGASSGVLGIHFSDLPRYRGGSPLVWALINQDPWVGISLFSLVDEIDAGPLWGTARVEVPPESYVADVLAEATSAAANLVRDLLPGIVDGTARPRPQPAEGVSYGGLRNPADGLIDWTRPAQEVAAFVRAQSRPYPGAYTWLDSRKVVVWRARAGGVPHYGAPGSVVRVSTEGVHVACGDHRPLILESVEVAGQGARDATKVLRSMQTRFSAAPAQGALP